MENGIRPSLIQKTPTTLLTRHCGYGDEQVSIPSVKTSTLWSGKQGADKNWPPTGLAQEWAQVGSLFYWAHVGVASQKRPGFGLGGCVVPALGDCTISSGVWDKCPHSYHTRQSEATTSHAEGRETHGV